jgi:ABC-type glycerol-3-phosphate transport system permease component
MTSLAGKPSISLSRVAIYAVLILAALLYLVPLVVMLLTSFKSPEDIGTGNLLSWPAEVTAIGWIKAWATVKGYFWNSILITVPAVLCRKSWSRRHASTAPASGAFSCRSCCRCRLPILIVAIILQVTGIWNDFLFGVVIFAGRENLPMTVQLNNIVNSVQGVKEYNVNMAAPS